MVTNIRQLRSSTREIFQAVERGEVVYISSRGKTRAKIIRYEESAPQKKISLAGLWKDNTRTASVKTFVRKLREPRHVR